MKPMQAIKGVKLLPDVKYNILDDFGAPLVLIQNQGETEAAVILNDGEPLFMNITPFGWEPATPISGTIETPHDSVVVFF